MKKITTISFLLLAVTLFSACGDHSTPIASPTVPFLPETTATPSVEPNYALNNAIQMLAQRLDLDAAQIEAVAVEAVDWPDVCLAVSLPGRMCAAVITPGYRIILEGNGRQYEVHTDRSGANIVLAAAPQPGIGELFIIWKSSILPCQTIEVGKYGAAAGDCGGVLLQAPFTSAERVNELKALVNSYRSFASETMAGEVVFTGKGDRVASASEQRSIAEWAKTTYLEAVNGRSEAPAGSAFTWHREGGMAGFCDDLVVFRSGMASATSCKETTVVNLGDFRLNTTQLNQLYNLLDTYQAGEILREDNPDGPDNLTATLSFNGTGDQPLTDAIEQELLAFASKLYLSFPQKVNTPSP